MSTTQVERPGPVAAPARASSVRAVLQLQHVKRLETYLTPLVVVVVAGAFTALVALVVWRLSDNADLGQAGDGGASFVPWWVMGYMGYNGVQSVATTFPLALSLGATRAAFTLGTIVHQARLAVYVAAVALLLLAAEDLTGGWFVDLRAVGVPVLGGGDPLQLVVTALLGTWTTLAVGGAFAALWVRGGARLTGGAGVAVGLLLALVALLLVPVLLPALADPRMWWLAVAASVVIAASALVQLLALRRAPVR